MIIKISKILDSICSQWALILSNGKIIETLDVSDKTVNMLKIHLCESLPGILTFRMDSLTMGSKANIVELNISKARRLQRQ